MKKTNINSISIIGAGNVATHFALALHNTGCTVRQVLTRDFDHASLLASRVGAQPINKISLLDDQSDVYLLAVNDEGEPFEVSPDPLKEEFQAKLAGVVWNDPSSYSGQLRPLLANESVFHVDYTKTPLADRIEGYFTRLLGGKGAVRRLLREELG